MADLWYLARKGALYGPYSREQLTVYVSEGCVAPDDMLRSGTDGEWQAASAVLGLPVPETGPFVSARLAALDRSGDAGAAAPAEAIAAPDRAELYSLFETGGEAKATGTAAVERSAQRRRRWLLPAIGTLVLVTVAAAAFLHFRPAPDPCPHHFPVSAGNVSLAFGASPDQEAIIALNGPPEAFTIYWDPSSGAAIEEWSYYTLGEELLFVDGVYQGGVEVPAPQLVEGAVIPSKTIYPWEIRTDGRASCVVQGAGPALFQTSALVLPGWNDGHQVARVWKLASGGTMITVDGHLAMVSIDPGEPIDMAGWSMPDLLIGTLGQGDVRQGAILTPGESPGTYQLSMSPRGQGTTADGTEINLYLSGSRLPGKYTLGDNARATRVDAAGIEQPAEASGEITVRRRGDAYLVRTEVWLGDPAVQVYTEGLLASGLWRGEDGALAAVLQETRPSAYRKGELQLPVMTRLPDEALAGLVAEGPSAPVVDSVWVTPPEVPAAWRQALYDPFDDNRYGWPLSQYRSELVDLRATLADGRYLMQVSKIGGVRPWIGQTVPYQISQSYAVSVNVYQPSGRDAECGLYLHEQGGEASMQLQVSSTEGRYRWVIVGGDKERVLVDWTISDAIRSSEANRLSVVASDSLLTAYINGQHVAQADRSLEAIDKLGLVARLGSQEPVSCAFDDLAVFVP